MFHNLVLFIYGIFCLYERGNLMFLQKYKGLILGIVGAVIGGISWVYLKDLDYIYRACLKLFSVTLIIIGWVNACNSNHFYKKKENNNV